MKVYTFDRVVNVLASTMFSGGEIGNRREKPVENRPSFKIVQMGCEPLEVCLRT